jgi:hypothetical protein
MKKLILATLLILSACSDMTQEDRRVLQVLAAGAGALSPRSTPSSPPPPPVNYSRSPTKALTVLSHELCPLWYANSPKSGESRNGMYKICYYR